MQSTNIRDSRMGTVGLAVTGGAFFNDLSNTDGSLALTNEGAGLDSCLGHSAQGGKYHYHANINCTAAGAATGASEAETEGRTGGEMRSEFVTIRYDVHLF